MNTSNNKCKYVNIIAALILGISLVAAVYINAMSKRYVHTSGYYFLDKWTGEVYHVKDRLK